MVYVHDKCYKQYTHHHNIESASKLSSTRKSCEFSSLRSNEKFNFENQCIFCGKDVSQ